MNTNIKIILNNKPVSLDLGNPILQNPHTRIYIKNSESKYKWCNTTFANHVGECVDSLTDQRDENLCWKKQTEVYLQNDRIVLNSEKELFTTEVRVSPTLEEHPCLIYKLPIQFDDSTEHHLLGISADLTQIQSLSHLFFADLLKGTITQAPTINASLTPRELQCMQLLAKCLTAKEIANQLNLSFRTVEGYIDNVKNKLNINKKSKLISELTRLKLI